MKKEDNLLYIEENNLMIFLICIFSNNSYYINKFKKYIFLFKLNIA